MKNIRQIIIWTAVILSCIFIITYAEDIAKAIHAAESNARIVYNGKEASLGIKPVLVEGNNYLSVRALAILFNKSIDWNQKEQIILISDKPDTALESLKSELASKNKSMTELEEKLKQLEKDIKSVKRLSHMELQDLINDEYGEYEGVTYRVIISGNEDEIRVKIEIDLSRDKSSWRHLTINKKKEMVKEICDIVSFEYDHARINGYMKDISSSKRLITFYNTYEGELEIGSYKNYNAISTLEDRFNNDYDRCFKGIHFAFTLNGNDNSVEYTIYIQKSRFEEEWDKLSDRTLENFMKKLCSEINNEFKGCYITGNTYDTDSSSELAYCEQTTDGDFIFSRE